LFKGIRSNHLKQADHHGEILSRGALAGAQLWEPRRNATVIDATSCSNPFRDFLEMPIMKTTLAIFAAAALALAVNSPANAKGCIKGAVVGGVAGHYAGHHGVLGAAAGCLYGRHHAKQQAREQEHQRQNQQHAQSGQGKM
jgi:hypothetical protein